MEQATTPAAADGARGRPVQTVQSVDRVLQILEIVAALPANRSASEIARVADLPAATVHRLLGVLHRNGYVTRSGREYKLGSKISLLSEIYEATYAPSAAVLECVHALAKASGESTFVSRWDGTDTSVVATVEGPRAVRVSGLSTGSSGFAYARASGKVLLAFAPESRMPRYLSGVTLVPRTPRTITDAASLRAEVARVRMQGYAIDNEEFEEGVCCISAPVFGIEDGIASLAITMSMPTYRFAEERDRVLALLRPAVEELTRRERGE